MSSENPFEVSSESYGDRSAVDRDASAAEVSARTIDMLNQTRPWVRLMSVLLWIGVVLMGLGGVFMVIASLASGEVGMIIVGAFYAVFAILYGFLARWLSNYASRITALGMSESVRDLEDALEAQKNFWRLIGIITLVVLALYVIAIVLVVAGVAVFPMMMQS